MKTLISVLAIATFLTTPVFAENHDGCMKGEDMKGGMMMSQDQMMAMHGHMNKMQNMMSDIMKESDPQKCQALMHEHMQAMHKGMQMMNGNMSMMPKAMDDEKPSQMGNMDMMKRMHMMEQRMGMMQMMMGQMMEHESVEQTGQCKMPH